MAIAVAAELMAQGSKVLLVDADPQGTATTWTEVAAEAGHATPTLEAMGANMDRPGQLDEVAKPFDVVVVDCPPRHGEVMRAALAIEKMRYDKKSGMVIYRSRPHATLKRNYQLMPALKWLRMLMNHIPDKYEHLVRYHGYYSSRSRGARRLVDNGNDVAESIRIDEPPADNRRKANWARLIQKVSYNVYPIETYL